MKHIGIVDVTTLGTTCCQLAIVNESSKALENGNHPEFSVHSLPFSRYQKALTPSGWDWDQVAHWVLHSIKSLEKGGADFIIIPNNTVHFAIGQIQNLSPLPVINMCDTVAFECVRQKVHTVAVLGTIYTMEDGLYEESLRTSGIQPVIPDETLRKKLNDMIFIISFM